MEISTSPVPVSEVGVPRIRRCIRQVRGWTSNGTKQQLDYYLSKIEDLIRDEAI